MVGKGSDISGWVEVRAPYGANNDNNKIISMVTLPAWFGTALLQCSILIRSQIGGLAALLPRDLALLIHLVFISDLLTLTSKIMSHAQVMHDSCPWFMIRLIMIHDSGPGFMLSCYPPKELGLLELSHPSFDLRHCNMA